MNNWPIKKLGEIVTTVSGTWGPTDNNGTAVLRSTNFTNEGHISFDNVAVRQIPQNKISELCLNVGDILLEKSGGGPKQPVGRVVFFDKEVKKPVVFGNFIQRLRSSKEMNSRYLFYALLHLYQSGHTSNLQNQTTGIRNLKLSLYLKTEIPLPPLDIQKQIVERLDKIAEAQKLNDLQISKTEELFQSLLHKELDPAGKNWEVKKLGEIVERITESILPTKHPDQEFNFIGLENIGSNTGQVVSMRPTRGNLIRSTKTVFRKNDVLYGKLRPYLNKVWLAEADGICSTDIWVLRTNQDVISPLLLSSILRQPQIVAKSAASMAGANLPRANKTVFDGIKISLPPLGIQKQIVAKLSAVQEYKKQLLAQKLKLKELFDSVLDRCMKGEM